MQPVEDTVRMFIVENFLYGDDNGFSKDASFLEEGIIDSTGILELVTFIEDEFSVTVEDDELIPENLDSVGNISAFLQSKIKLIVN